MHGTELDASNTQHGPALVPISSDSASNEANPAPCRLLNPLTQLERGLRDGSKASLPHWRVPRLADWSLLIAPRPPGSPSKSCPDGIRSLARAALVMPVPAPGCKDADTNTHERHHSHSITCTRNIHSDMNTQNLDNVYNNKFHRIHTIRNSRSIQQVGQSLRLWMVRLLLIVRIL